MLLHKHNQETYQNMISLFKEHNRVAAIQPTGTGKSFLMLQLINDNQNKKFLITSPSVYIFTQIKTHAEDNSISTGNCVFLTFSRLSGMSEEEISKISADYIIIDEFHRCGAAEWSKGVENLLNSQPNAKVFGTSATPIRYLDSFRNMAEELFDNCYAVNMSLAEAIRKNILPLPIYVTSWYSFSGDMALLEKKAETSDNPYYKRVLYGKIRKAKTIIADKNCGLERIFAKHMKNKKGKYIVFCSNEERLCQAYSEAKYWFSEVNLSINKYSVYSNNSDSHKEFEMFRDDTDKKSLKLLFCIDMLNEGVHVDDIDGVIMLRATQSANVFYQQLGRALSCSAGKQPVIFDIVNNFETGDTAKQYHEIMQIGRENGKSESEFDIQFELYDYVRDIRELLSDIRNTFEDSWEVVYEALKEYKEKNQKFPEYFEEYGGYKLGVWCSNQRVLRNSENLLQERIDKLNELNFIWDARDDRWMSSYQITKAFYEKNGRLPVRSDTVSSDDLENVYHWVCQQRQQIKNGALSSERIKLLEQIGFATESKTADDLWYENFSLLAEFAAENHRFPAISDSKESELTNKIYHWMLRQREYYKKGKLSEERIRKLESIGFVWDAKMDLWNRQFTLLKAFVEQNHRPPTAKDKIQGAVIGQWYLKQKKMIDTGKLSPELCAKIQALNILEIDNYDAYNDSAWQKNFAALKQFLDEFHRLPYTDELYHGIELYQWLFMQKQRCRERKLKQEYIDMFSEIGIDIACFTSSREMPRPSWMRTYTEYRTFLETMHRRPSTKEKKLYDWQVNMRLRYKNGNLKQSQIDLLRYVGVIE